MKTKKWNKSYLKHTYLNHPIPPYFHPTFPSPLILHFCPPFPPAPNLLRKSYLISLPMGIHVCFLGFYLLPVFSGVMDYRLVFFCLTSNIHIWVSMYRFCLPGSELPLSVFFFCFIPLCYYFVTTDGVGSPSSLYVLLSLVE